MDIEKLNDAYIKFYGVEEVKDENGSVVKPKVPGTKDKIEANIKKYEDEINKAADEKAFWKHAKSDPAIAAKLGKTNSEIDTEIKNIDGQLKDFSDKLKKQKDALVKFKDDLDKNMEELKKKPEIANLLNESMAKQYDRKMFKLEQKSENAKQGKNNMTVVQNAYKNAPFIKQALQDVLKLKEDKKALITKLNSLASTDPARATIKSDIKKIEKQEKGIKDNILTTLQISKGDFSMDDLEAAFNQIEKHMNDKKGNPLSLDESIKRSISYYNREINSTEKEIEINMVAYTKLGISVENPKSKSAKQVETIRETHENVKLQREIDKAKEEAKNKLIEEENKRRNSLVPARKPKWYQFVERFQQWRNSKKVTKLLPVEEALKDEIEKAEKQAEKDATDAFNQAKIKEKEAQQKGPNMRDALKYAVVKAIRENEKSNKWEDAKRTIKGTENEER